MTQYKIFIVLLLTLMTMLLCAGCTDGQTDEQLPDSSANQSQEQPDNPEISDITEIPEDTNRTGSDEAEENNALGYVRVDAETAKNLMDTETGYIILDVRTDEEYAEGHIPDSILIPDYEIRERAEKELTDKNQLILVYCRSGNRSKTASAILAELGYTNVVEFGGIRSWPYEIVN